MPGVWVFSEKKELNLELLSIGQKLSSDLNQELITFCFSQQEAEDYIKAGGQRVFVLPEREGEVPLEAYAEIFGELAEKEKPEVFLLGATLRGKQIAAQVASKLKTGLSTDCIAVSVENGTPVFERLVYGGLGVQKVAAKSRPAMATIPEKTYPRAELGERQGVIEKLTQLVAGREKIVATKPRRSEALDLSEAKIIVGVGRGIEREEDLSLARDLCKVLGAELACSRPLAEEMNWLPEERYIGLSGQKVKPDLYIAIGISGQVQHMAGVRDAKLILAINRDENAPIFKAADYGIVGDLYEVVPSLTKELQNALGG